MADEDPQPTTTNPVPGVDYPLERPPEAVFEAARAIARAAAAAHVRTERAAQAGTRPPICTYAAVVTEPNPGEFLVAFPDVPEAITGGSSLEEAVSNAPDALAAALEHYQAAGLPFPARRMPGTFDVTTSLSAKPTPEAFAFARALARLAVAEDNARPTTD